MNNCTIIVPSGDLYNAIRCVLPTAKTKSPITAYSTVHLSITGKTLTISARNEDEVVSVDLDVDNMEGSLDLAMFAPSSFDVLSQLPPQPIELRFIVSEDKPVQMVITSDNAQYHNTAELDRDFQADLFEKNFEKKPAFSILAEDFVAITSRVATAAAKDEIKPGMSTLNFESVDGHLCIVATDGHIARKFQSETIKTSFEFQDVLMPIWTVERFTKSFRALGRQLPWLAEADVAFLYTDTYQDYPTFIEITAGGNYVYRGRLSAATAPAWESVWPSEFTTEAVVKTSKLRTTSTLMDVYGDYFFILELDYSDLRFFTSSDWNSAATYQKIPLEEFSGEPFGPRAISIQPFKTAVSGIKSDAVRIYCAGELIVLGHKVESIRPDAWQVEEQVLVVTNELHAKLPIDLSEMEPMRKRVDARQNKVAV